MSRLSTHILDTSLGRPAVGVAVVLEIAASAGAWIEISRGITDADGRVKDLLPDDEPIVPGDYRLRFATADYFRKLGQIAFYPEVVVHVRLDGSANRYHLPLLLNPFGYSTYRGS